MNGAKKENGSIRIRRRLKAAGALGTFINAMGLAVGIWLIDSQPSIAVFIIVFSIVVYAIVRLVVWGYDNMLLTEEARNGVGAAAAQASVFPGNVRYRAELENVKADLHLVRDE